MPTSFAQDGGMSLFYKTYSLNTVRSHIPHTPRTLNAQNVSWKTENLQTQTSFSQHPRQPSVSLSTTKKHIPLSLADTSMGTSTARILSRNGYGIAYRIQDGYSCRLSTQHYRSHKQTATAVSRYEAQKKRIAADIDDSDLKNADKLASSYALNSLAEDDPITYITHHLKSTAGFNIDILKPNPPCEQAIQRVRDVTKQSEQDEKSATEKVALNVFDAEIERLTVPEYTAPQLHTTSEARKMSATEYTVLGNKKATEMACLIGFDDLSDFDRGTLDNPIAFDWLLKDLKLAQRLILSSIDTSHWKQRFFGYLATRNTVISDEHWGIALESGNELSAIRDYAFIGELVRRIIDTTAGKKYDTKSLTAELTCILNTLTDDGSRTYLTEIQSGAIGVKTWRKARYLNVSTSPIDFCIELTETFYPCTWRKYRDQISVHNDAKLDLFAESLNTFLYHQRSPEMHDLDAAFGGTDKIVDVKPFPETEDPENRFYANVRKMFTNGKSIDEIIEITGLSKRKIYDVTKDLRVSGKKQTDMQLQTDALKMLDKGMSKRAVAETLKISRTKLNRILSP